MASARTQFEGVAAAPALLGEDIDGLGTVGARHEAALEQVVAISATEQPETSLVVGHDEQRCPHPWGESKPRLPDVRYLTVISHGM